METLAIDVGTTMVGILSADDRAFTPYTGNKIVDLAIPRIIAAKEIITYNGDRYDLLKLGERIGLPENLPMSGIHTDMETVCWGNINGRNLFGTYAMHREPCPPFPETYEGSNERDCYMTLKLWEWWKAGTLLVIGGNYY
jgi:hypothetical protein